MSNTTALPPKVVAELAEITKEFLKDFPGKSLANLSNHDMNALLFIWPVREIIKLGEKFD
jgi:hypothetical protein